MTIRKKKTRANGKKRNNKKRLSIRFTKINIKTLISICLFVFVVLYFFKYDEEKKKFKKLRTKKKFFFFKI